MRVYTPMYTPIVIIIKLPITKPVRILNLNSISVLNAGIQGLKGLIQLQVVCEIALKLINIISSFISFLQFPVAEVVRQVLIRVNVSLIGSHIIRGPKSISISSYFLILPLRVIKNKLYMAKLRILRIGRIALISWKV